MSKAWPVLHTTEPVRDRSWWLRSAVYWVLLCFQEAASDRAGPVALWWAVMVVPCAVAVYVRDRCPWALALLGLGLTATMAQIPITLGRQRWRGVPDSRSPWATRRREPSRC